MQNLLKKIDMERESLKGLMDTIDDIKNIEGRIVSLKYVLENKDTFNIKDEYLKQIEQEFNNMTSLLYIQTMQFKNDMNQTLKRYDANLYSILENVKNSKQIDN